MIFHHECLTIFKNPFVKVWESHGRIEVKTYKTNSKNLSEFEQKKIKVLFYLGKKSFVTMFTLYNAKLKPHICPLFLTSKERLVPSVACEACNCNNILSVEQLFKCNLNLLPIRCLPIGLLCWRQIFLHLFRVLLHWNLYTIFKPLYYIYTIMLHLSLYTTFKPLYYILKLKFSF